MSNTIVSSTTATAPTGLANEGHTLYDGTRWWHFYWASSTSIASLYSSDGVTWTAGASLTVTSGNQDGRDLTAAFAVIASTNVVHLAWTNTSRQGEHVRGTISGTTLTWGSSSAAGTAPDAGEAEPHGYGVAIASDGTIFQASGNGDDFSAVRSTTKDTTASWTNSFSNEAFVVTTHILNQAHNRALVPYAAGAKVLGLSGDGSSATAFSQLYYNVWSGTAWGSEASTGTTSQSQDPNDWGVVRLSDTDFHVVRRTSTGFEHRRFSGTSWSAGSTVTSGVTSKAGSGVALASDGTSVWLIVVDSGAANNVKYSQWTSGSGWSAWTTLESSSATRNYVSISEQQDASGNWLVSWTEGTASPWAIKDALLATGGGGGGTVSGSATLVDDAVLLDTPNALVAPASPQANATLAASAQLLAPAAVQANATLADAPNLLLVSSAPMPATAALADSPNLLITPSLPAVAGAGMRVTGTLLANAAPVPATALLAAPAVLVEPSAPVPANTVLSGTGGLAGQGGGSLVATTTLSVAGQVAAPATVATTAVLAAPALLRANGQTLAASALLTAPAAVLEPAAVLAATAVLHGTPAVGAANVAVTSNAALVATSARVLAPAALSAGAALAEVARILALAAALHAEAVLAGAGHISAPNNLLDGTVVVRVRDGTAAILVRDGTVTAAGRDGTTTTEVR